MDQALNLNVLVKGIILNILKSNIEHENEVIEYLKQYIQLGLSYATVENCFLKLKKERLIKIQGEMENRRFVLVGDFPTWAADLSSLEMSLSSILSDRRHDKEIEDLKRREKALHGGTVVEETGGPSTEDKLDKVEETPKVDKRTREYRESKRALAAEVETPKVVVESESGYTPTKIKILTKSGESSIETIEIETVSSVEIIESIEEIRVRISGREAVCSK